MRDPPNKKRPGRDERKGRVVRPRRRRKTKDSDRCAVKVDVSSRVVHDPRESE